MSIRSFRLWSFTISAVCLTTGSVVAADWTSFRNGGGSQVASILPTTWSSSQGIAWQRELIGYGQSTPVVHENRVYLAAVEGAMKETCVLQCLDLKSGSEIWKFEIGSSNKSVSNYSASRAAPTPVVDGNAVYAFFESGDVVAVDKGGKALWHRNLTADYGKFENGHGLGASPAETDRCLILNIEHKGPSYLVALDKRTGKTEWKTDRPSSSSWSSPIVMVKEGSLPDVVVSSAGSVSGYDATTGQRLWEIGGLDGNSVPSPTLHGSKLFVGARLPEFAEEGGSSSSNCCVDLAKREDGKPTFLWRAEKVTSDYASPVVLGECAYYLNKAGVLYCLDIESGKAHYTKRLGTQCWGTPIVSHDRIYFFGKDGKTVVLKGGTEFEVIATNELWDPSNPPKPEVYVEGTRAERSNSSEATGGERSPGPGGRGGPGGGMMATLAAADKDKDGLLSPEEIPADFKPMLARLDTNSDGSLDQAEMKAMAESFAARRANSTSDARDPIVYGAVASDGRILIRTGTRLYCIE